LEVEIKRIEKSIDSHIYVLFGSAMAQAVSRRLLTAEARVRSRGQSHVGFVVDEVAMGQVFPTVLRFSPVSFVPPVLHYFEKRKKLIIITGLHNCV
jgi:hypothetical protein